jgi:hypothetical protein
MWRGARLGLLAGIALAALYIALGIRVHEFTELLGYSVGVVGFPALFAAILSSRPWGSGVVWLRVRRSYL